MNIKWLVAVPVYMFNIRFYVEVARNLKTRYLISSMERMI